MRRDAGTPSPPRRPPPPPRRARSRRRLGRPTRRRSDRSTSPSTMRASRLPLRRGPPKSLNQETPERHRRRAPPDPPDPAGTDPRRAPSVSCAGEIPPENLRPQGSARREESLFAEPTNGSSTLMTHTNVCACLPSSRRVGVTTHPTARSLAGTEARMDRPTGTPVVVQTNDAGLDSSRPPKAERRADPWASRSPDSSGFFLLNHDDWTKSGSPRAPRGRRRLLGPSCKRINPRATFQTVVRTPNRTPNARVRWLPR